MKSEVLQLLRTNMPHYISGEEISNVLQVSRTAIWKHIKSLREDGYIIESHPRVGYRLISLPDRLYPDEITSRLKTQLIGNSVAHFESTGSTNDIAKDLATAGAPEGLIVVAEEQTKGRGRLGRVWHSPAGKGIWFSVVLRPKINPMDAPKLTLMAAVALARAMQKVTTMRVGIKWPNDIFINGRKVAGILTEMSAELDRVNHIILGIGINVNIEQLDLPEELTSTATSLCLENGGILDRRQLLVLVLEELDVLYQLFNKGAYGNIFTEWKEYSITLNKQVKVTSQGFSLEGRALDLDDEGALILKKNDGSIEKILAGEIMFI